MAGNRRSLVKLVALGLFAGVAAYALTSAFRPTSRRPPAESSAALTAAHATFELHPDSPQLTVRSRDRAVARDVALALVVDGAPYPVVLAQIPGRADPDALVATAAAVIADGQVEFPIELRVDSAHDAIAITATAPPAVDLGGHTFALQADMASDGQVVFVAGVGPVADRATIAGSSMTVDTEPHPIAITSAAGPILVDAMPDEAPSPGEPTHVTVTSPTGEAGGEQLAELDVVMGASSASVWRDLAEITGTPTAPVHGRVTGTAARAIVVGRDAEGRPQVRARTGEGGAFELDVPTTIVSWYAAVEPGRASPLVPFAPGTPRDLVLDVSPGGNVHVTVRDADTREPLTARLLFRGIDGTVDPSFGPDYRASGAGPVMDSLRGDVVTPMPSGRYRVAATKGIEWSVDAKIVDVAPGAVTEIDLAPRHVVPTPGVLGCDLHVHARPSFDSPVTPEDRVLSLAAAGIDFAVPTEHNIVGDYGSAIETLGLRGELSSVTGVEVTTLSKGFGHFGVFPYPPGTPVPPFKHTNMMAIFRAVRGGDTHRYFQLNHPRLPKGIGYFANIGLDPNAPMSRVRNRIDFDGIEVYNGYDIEHPERVEQVLRDYWALLDNGWRYTATGSSDSHRIQFHWAGYPRTMVTVDPEASPDAEAKPVDPLVVVSNIMKGHATITSGPILELSLGGVHPGDEVATTDETIRGHLRIRAAPWVDVAHVAIVVGQVGGSYSVVQTFDVQSRPTQVGAEEGALAEVQARTIRFDRDLEVPVGPENGWIQVIARGERRMDDVLPFMPVPPFAFTNPVYVVRRPAVPPPFPGAAMPRGVP
jgi:hypothetical protein